MVHYGSALSSRQDQWLSFFRLCDDNNIKISSEGSLAYDIWVRRGDWMLLEELYKTNDFVRHFVVRDKPGE